jgi:hypothetical protein
VILEQLALVAFDDESAAANWPSIVLILPAMDGRCRMCFRKALAHSRKTPPPKGSHRTRYLADGWYSDCVDLLSPASGVRKRKSKLGQISQAGVVDAGARGSGEKSSPLG